MKPGPEIRCKYLATLTALPNTLHNVSTSTRREVGGRLYTTAQSRHSPISWGHNNRSCKTAHEDSTHTAGAG